jgi:hypothetical protein
MGTNLSEGKIDGCTGVLNACLLERLRDRGRSAEVGLASGLATRSPSDMALTYADGVAELSIGARQILPALDGHAQARIYAFPVGAAKEGARAKKRQRIVGGASVVDGNVPERIFVNLLREVDVDAKEIGCLVVSI